jgi:hypothetical protein
MHHTTTQCTTSSHCKVSCVAHGANYLLKLYRTLVRCCTGTTSHQTSHKASQATDPMLTREEQTHRCRQPSIHKGSNALPQSALQEANWTSPFAAQGCKYYSTGPITANTMHVCGQAQHPPLCYFPHQLLSGISSSTELQQTRSTRTARHQALHGAAVVTQAGTAALLLLTPTLPCPHPCLTPCFSPPRHCRASTHTPQANPLDRH